MIHVKIDGKTEFKGEASDYVTKTPDMFKDAIKPGARPMPWMKCIGLVFVEAVQSSENVNIFVTTGNRKWTMEVSELK